MESGSRLHQRTRAAAVVVEGKSRRTPAAFLAVLIPPRRDQEALEGDAEKGAKPSRCRVEAGEEPVILRSDELLGEELLTAIFCVFIRKQRPFGADTLEHRNPVHLAEAIHSLRPNDGIHAPDLA